MYILGITEKGHDSAACLLQNGKLLSFVEEERLTRIKNAPNQYPFKASHFCLQKANINLSDVAYIAVGWNLNKYEGYMQQFYKKLDNDYNKDHVTRLNERMLLARFNREQVIEEIRQGFLKEGYSLSQFPNIVFVDHHLAHAASSYYSSGFRKATILTIDGAGEDIGTAVWYGEGASITLVDDYQLPHSLGWFYAAITEYLGFLSNSHEGKVMGLAAYGCEDRRIREVLQKVLCIRNGRYYVDPNYIFYGDHNFGIRFTDLLVAELGKPRRRNEEITQFYKNVAYVAQDIIEEVIINMVKDYTEKLDSRNVCLAGGVAMNCKLNGEIADLPGVNSVFVQPASSDAGTALGAAMIVSQNNGYDPRFTMTHAYWGPNYSNNEVLSALQLAKVRYTYIENPSEVAAKLLAQNKILGWFQGASEVGARALGARSILANPSGPEMKSSLNSVVKFREAWRPFAPSLIIENAEEVFDSRDETPFMLVARRVLAEKRDVIPSAIHIDGTARPQTVTREANPRYWELINQFQKITNVPAILNTSFNIKDEPIVSSPLDAIRCFYSTGLDALVIENYLILKDESLLTHELLNNVEEFIAI
ncbi:carbamoyltransferase family protein [Paenibacillus glycinis]|uniref:Carbamoyltransferase n=1 Tax=Paenibacillus glycinis TaxID=2697035 RepID=A0ABW9XS93_9BACL|nr:carbamoyltransferase C-terminal domain-containing protein [Paenibacillus glycinis]NBD25530.1 hypothetical protein [Paenibacillus glycinis]